MTYLDEVHAVGLYGPRGGESPSATASPAVNHHSGHPRKGVRVMGGYVAGWPCWSISCAVTRRVLFTSALPPLLAAGALAAVRHLKESRSEREAQSGAGRRRESAPRRRAIPVRANDSHIVPVWSATLRCAAPLPTCCCASIRFTFTDQLSDRARGTERLRLTPTPLRSDADIEA